MGVKATPSAVPALADDWATLEALLPPQWQAKARELGAFKRGRVIPDAQTLLRVMLIHLTQGCGLRQPAELARLGGIASVSAVAILKRLRNCGDWFEWMCREMRAQWLLAPLRSPLASCWADWRIRLGDGSLVSEPGVTGSQWSLHYAIDLPSLRADEVIVSSRQEGETLKRFTFKPAEIVVADHGFANPPGVAHVHQAGAPGSGWDCQGSFRRQGLDIGNKANAVDIARVRGIARCEGLVQRFLKPVGMLDPTTAVKLLRPAAWLAARPGAGSASPA
jgi:hypothetical protein